MKEPIEIGMRHADSAIVDQNGTVSRKKLDFSDRIGGVMKEKGVKHQHGSKEENRTVSVMWRKPRLRRDRDEVKWSKAIKEIEGMKVRDGENKIIEGGREIEKGTLGSRSKSV